MSFAQVMSVYLSRWDEGVQNMLFIVQNVNKKQLVDKFEQIINHWRAWTAAAESLAAL